MSATWGGDGLVAPVLLEINLLLLNQVYSNRYNGLVTGKLITNSRSQIGATLSFWRPIFTVIAPICASPAC